MARAVCLVATYSVATGMSASTGGERYRTFRNVTNPPRKRNQMAVTRESERAISTVEVYDWPVRTVGQATNRTALTLATHQKPLRLPHPARDSVTVEASRAPA